MTSKGGLPIIRRHGDGGMDYERWVNHHIDLLKMKSFTSDLSLTNVPMPKRLSEKIFKVDVDDRNTKGETLMIAVIRYVCDELKQAQFLHILLRMGADPNLGDSKNQRTPLMYASLYKQVSAVRILSNQRHVLLGLKDRLGNTALMYAALQGEKTIIDLLAVRLARSWSFDVFLNKNQKGNTAETMATGNQKYTAADVLRSTRVRMLQRMHKQLALIHYSAELRGWKGYTEAYRAAKIWQSKRSRRRATTSLPALNHLNHPWNLALINTNSNTINGDHQADEGNGNGWTRSTELHPIVFKPRAKSCVTLKVFNDQLLTK